MHTFGCHRNPIYGNYDNRKNKSRRIIADEEEGRATMERAQAIADVAQDANHDGLRRHHSRSLFAVVYHFTPLPLPPFLHPHPPQRFSPIGQFCYFLGNLGYSELLWRVKG
jgi:hypothetical protein